MEESMLEPRRPHKRNEAKEVGKERCTQKNYVNKKVPQEGNWSVTVDSFHKAGKIRKNSQLRFK